MDRDEIRRAALKSERSVLKELLDKNSELAKTLQQTKEALNSAQKYVCLPKKEESNTFVQKDLPCVTQSKERLDEIIHKVLSAFTETFESHLRRIVEQQFFVREALLTTVSEETKAKVTENLGTYGQLTDKLAEDLYESLVKNFCSSMSNTYENFVAQDELINVLTDIPHEELMKFYEKLEDNDENLLANNIRKKVLTFDDIVLLDDRAIQKVLREIDSFELASAMTHNADDEIKNKIFRNMSLRAIKMLKDDIELNRDLTSPQDSDQSKRAILSVIERLEDAGEIVIHRNNFFI